MSLSSTLCSTATWLQFRSQTKFALGVLLNIGTTLALLMINIMARYNYLEYSTSNLTSSTIQCVFHHDTIDAWSLSLDYRWMAIPDFLYSLSITLLGIGATEFIVAQSPYSMRGLIVGSGLRHPLFVCCTDCGSERTVH